SLRSAGGPRPQHVARSRWSGAFRSLSTSYAAADRAFAAPKWLQPRRRDGPRSSGGSFKMRLIWSDVQERTSARFSMRGPANQFKAIAAAHGQIFRLNRHDRTNIGQIANLNQTGFTLCDLPARFRGDDSRAGPGWKPECTGFIPRRAFGIPHFPIVCLGTEFAHAVFANDV